MPTLDVSSGLAPPAVPAPIERGTAEADVDEILRPLAAAAGELLGADRASIALLDPDGAVRVRAMWGGRSEEWRDVVIHPPEGGIGRILSADKTIVIERIGEDPTLPIEAFPVIQIEGGRTVLGTPLRVAGRATGVLVAVWRQDVVPSAMQVRQIETLAHHAATVLEKARSLARERTLRELTGALAAHLDEARVLDLAVGHAAALLETPYAQLWLIAPDGGLRCAAAHGQRRTEMIDQRLPAESIAGMAAHGQTLRLADASSHPTWRDLIDSPIVSARSYLGTSIRRAGTPLGALEVLDNLGRAFDAGDELILRALADAVAVAVANARTHRAVQTEIGERRRAEATIRRLAEQRKRLLELSRLLLATLSFDEVIARLLGTLGDVLPYDAAGVYLLDEAASVLRPQRVVGGESIAPALASWPIPLDQGIVGQIARSGRAEMVNDAHLDPRAVYPAGTTIAREHLIGVPVVERDRTIAVLMVARRAQPFDQEELDLVELFTSHAEIAIEHARLFEQTRHSEARYRALFEGSRDAVYIVDGKGRFVDVNQACVDLLGYAARDEVLALDIPTQVYADPAEVERLREALDEHTYVRDFPAVARRKDGRLIHVIQTTTVERDDEGEIRLYWGVGRDVTDVRRAEEALREAERRERQSEKLRALGQMASGIAHDLNQQLGLVVGHGELGLRDLDSAPIDVEAARDALRAVVRAAMDGADTVKRLLSFARPDPEGKPGRVDLGGLLTEVAKLTAPRWRDDTQREGRPVDLRVDSTGEAAIDGWATSLREAFANLVLNAVDALPSGGSIWLTARKRAGDVEAVVEDNGVGIAAEAQARIFEPFFSTKGERGTGLGLPIVFRIVERHGGRIAVTSTVGRGTRFTLTFPAAAASPPAAPVPPPVAPRTVLRILIVDDEPDLRAMMGRMLVLDGHVVDEVGSGEEAVERLEASEYDLVVSDVGMGAGMNGWELADVVRARWPSLRFVLATGWGAQIDPDQATRRGVQAVVAKPYRIGDLLKAITPRISASRATSPPS